MFVFGIQALITPNIEHCLLASTMSATMTETASVKPENWGSWKSQVQSWIDEQHCVTAQRISQSLDISRKAGSDLLNEILQENPKHQITTCQQKKDGNTTGKHDDFTFFFCIFHKYFDSHESINPSN